MAVRIYKDAEGKFRKENNIIPATKYRLVYNSDQSQAGIYSATNNRALIELQPLSQIQNEAGTPYNNAAELEAALEGFFSLAGADRIPDSLIFASAGDRDTFFTANKDLLYPGLDIITDGNIETWVDIANPPVYDNTNWATYSEPLTAAEIKALYESNANTNALIDAKLAILNYLTENARGEVESAVTWIFPPGSIKIGDTRMSSGARVVTVRSESTGNIGALIIQLFDDDTFYPATVYDPDQTGQLFDIQIIDDTANSGTSETNVRQVVQNSVQLMKVRFKPNGGTITQDFRFIVKLAADGEPVYDETISPASDKLTDLGGGVWELELANPAQFDAGNNAYITVSDLDLLGGNGFDGSDTIRFGDPTKSDFFPYLQSYSIPIVRKPIATKGAWGAGYFTNQIEIDCDNEDQWYKVDADFTPTREDEITFDTINKRWVYNNGGEYKSFYLTFTGSHDDGSTRRCEWEFRINGSSTVYPQKKARIESGDTMSVTMLLPSVYLNNGDYIEIYCRITDSDNDKIRMESAIIEIR